MQLMFWTHTIGEWEPLVIDSHAGLEKDSRKHELVFLYDALDQHVSEIAGCVNSDEFLNAHPERIHCRGVYLSRAVLRNADGFYCPKSMRFDFVENASLSHNEIFRRRGRRDGFEKERIEVAAKFDMGALLEASNFPGTSNFPARTWEQAIEELNSWPSQLVNGGQSPSFVAWPSPPTS